MQVKAECWNFYCWYECLGHRYDEVQWRNYRLDKIGITEYGQEDEFVCTQEVVTRLYTKRKVGGGGGGGVGQISIEECITAERRGMYD